MESKDELYRYVIWWHSARMTEVERRAQLHLTATFKATRAAPTSKHKPQPGDPRHLLTCYRTIPKHCDWRAKAMMLSLSGPQDESLRMTVPASPSIVVRNAVD
jgi:hypothetical protein